MGKFSRAITILLTAVLFISGCGKPQSASNGEKSLVVAQASDAVSLDPHKANDGASATPEKQIYNTLVVLDKDMKVAPSLATEWKTIDDRTWEFKLREGVKFHNGEELKASDVVFTFNRFTNPETATVAGFLLSTVEEVKAVDDYTVQIITKEPFAPLIYNLTHVPTSILNEKAVTEAGADYAIHPIGTGPFKFVDWKRNQEIVFEKNPDYFLGAPQLDKLTIRIIPESATSFSELKTGGVDVVLDVQTQYADQFGEGKGIVLSDFTTLGTKYIGFDHRVAPFDDVRVRQAINYAVDKNAIINVVYDGNAEPLNQPMLPNVNGYDPDIKGYEYNPEKAKELLAEAGYPDGFTTTLYISEKEEDTKIATVAQAQLKEVGINVDIQVMEWGAYLDKLADGVPFFILGWVTVTADADNGMYGNFYTSENGRQGNRIFYKNPTVDQLLDAGRAELDPEKRTEIYKEVSRITTDEAVWDFLVGKKYLVGLNERVKNFTPSPTTIFEFYPVTVD